MIVVRFDYTVGNEISYVEGMNKEDDFATNCLSFFSSGPIANVLVVKQDGSYINRDELLLDSSPYTSKEVRPSHNLEKMLKAGAFKFRPLIKE